MRLGVLSDVLLYLVRNLDSGLAIFGCTLLLIRLM